MTTLNNHVIQAIDVGLLGLDRVASIFVAIDALDLGVGGKHYDTLCALRDIGVAVIKEARAELNAIPVCGDAS